MPPLRRRRPATRRCLSSLCSMFQHQPMNFLSELENIREKGTGIFTGERPGDVAGACSVG